MFVLVCNCLFLWFWPGTVVLPVEALTYFQNKVCWLRGYLIILKLFAGIEMVARPVTFEMVANEAAVTFGVMFDTAFVGTVFPTTKIYNKYVDKKKFKHSTKWNFLLWIVTCWSWGSIHRWCHWRRCHGGCHYNNRCRLLAWARRWRWYWSTHYVLCIV